MSETPIDFHPEQIDRFERFTELSGLAIEDPSERVDSLKTIGSDQFLDLLSVTNGLVRGEEGFTRWSGKAAMSKVMMNGITDIDPPDNAHEAFGDFLKGLQESIEGPEDLDRAAVETYFAIIGSHMFVDGNGRTARAAYEMIKHGEVPDNQNAIIDRQNNSVGAAERLNFATIHNLFVKEGYEEGVEFGEIFDLAVDDQVNDKDFIYCLGYDAQLKYIAARRVMDRAGVWEQRGSNHMGIKDWPPKRFAEFKDEYANVRDEWFDEFTATAGRHHEFLTEKLEEGVERVVQPPKPE